MNPFLLVSFLLLVLLCNGFSVSWAAPAVSNVRVSQRAGTDLVDVYYNLSGSGAGGAFISLELSDNAGTSYGLPISSLSGHVGSGIANGTNRQLVWNAGTDRSNSFSAAMRLRLTAVDTSSIPDGFSLIPAGSFQMGDSFLDAGTVSGEFPVHSVYVSNFYMAKYETTKELWDEVRIWGVANGYTDLTEGGGKAANHPVHSISWFDMVKWCNARSQKDGLTPVYTVSGGVMKTGTAAPAANWSANGYRLPTEAEWEKAARGGVSGKRFPWGTDTISHSQANFRNDGGESYQSGTTGNHPTYAVGGLPFTSPVGSFAPNGYGLYDMAGNVIEWCWDFLDDDYYSTTAASSPDPKGPNEGSRRVLRGGNWRIGSRGAYFSRVSYRHSASNPLFDRGFRIVRSSVP